MSRRPDHPASLDAGEMAVSNLESAGPTMSVRRLAPALTVLIATLVVSTGFLLARRPLGQLSLLTDEWWLLGLNWARQGTLGVGNEPAVFRAPGYPFFIAWVVRLFAPVPDTIPPGYGQRVGLAVCLSQCVLLAIAAFGLHGWLKRHVRAEVAFSAALMFGCNPYCVALCGLLHYDVLHLCVLILACWAADAALAAPSRRTWCLAGAGLLFGLATLVRSVTLLLPPFLLVLGLEPHGQRGFWRRAGQRALPLTRGMVLAIAPWTLRNFAVAGVFVPVNLQGWMAVWGSTVQPLPRDPNRYLWNLIANSRDYLPIFSRVTGAGQYSYQELARFNVPLEQAFRQEAWRNIREHPSVYAGNALRSFLTFNLDINSALLAVFERIQAPEPGSFQPGWYTREGAPERSPTAVSRGFAAWVGVLTALALVGAFWAWRRRQAWALLPAAAYASLCAAHTLTYMDFMYYYVKLPFLMVFAAVGCEALARVIERRLHQPGAGLMAASPAYALAAASLALSALLWIVTSGR